MHTILIAALLCGPPASQLTSFNPPANPQPVAAFDVRLLRIESDAGAALALTRTEELTAGGEPDVRLELSCGGKVVATGTDDGVVSPFVLPGVQLPEGGGGGATCMLEDPPDVPVAEIDWDALASASYQVSFSSEERMRSRPVAAVAEWTFSVRPPGVESPVIHRAKRSLETGTWNIGSVVRIPQEADGTEHVWVLLVRLVELKADPRPSGPQLTLIGRKAIPLEVEGWAQTEEGAAMSLDALEGRVVLLDFWATWCSPCVAELPKTRDLARSRRTAGLRVIGVHASRGGEGRAAFLAERDLELPFATCWDASGATSRAYGVKGIPHYVLIDRRGTIRWAGRYVSEGTIDALLAER